MCACESDVICVVGSVCVYACMYVHVFACETLAKKGCAATPKSESKTSPMQALSSTAAAKKNNNNSARKRIALGQ